MVTISTQAMIALRSLLPKDKRRVEQQIQLLERFPENSAIHQKAKPLKSFSDLYIMKVTPQLRIIFKLSDEMIEILDVVTHDRLAKMYQLAH